MSNDILYPQDQVRWYINTQMSEQLRGDIRTDVVVIGGGIAGLSAAQSFADEGRSVTLIEKYYCGAGATGKSSGFITPDSELNLTDFARRFGIDLTKKVWDLGTLGVEYIRTNVQKHAIACNYQLEDTVVVANSARSFKILQHEDELRRHLNYESFLYQKADVPSIVGSDNYYGAIRYGNTFGIDMYHYCQGMRRVLLERGVRFYEETPALAVNDDTVITPHGTVKAKHIIVCVDKGLPQLHRLADTIYHVQTFVMISEPLAASALRQIFPEKNLMVWDTDLIYTYYRVVEGNRFLIGGATYLSSFWGSEQHDYRSVFRKLTRYVQAQFPDVPLHFTAQWPGLIGITKDLRAIAGPDRDNKHLYYICGTTGLPWGAALGWYSAQSVLHKKNDLNAFFDPYRRYTINKGLQAIVGKRIAFSLSMLAAKGKLEWLGL